MLLIHDGYSAATNVLQQVLVALLALPSGKAQLGAYSVEGEADALLLDVADDGQWFAVSVGSKGKAEPLVISGALDRGKDVVAR